MSESVRRVVLNMNFACALAMILIILYFLPSIEIDSEFFNSVYEQINFNSRHFEFFKFLFYIFSVFLGYILASKISQGDFTLKRNLKNLLIILAFSLIIFFSSGNTVLKGLHDFEGFCDSNSLKLFTDHKNDGAIGYFLFRLMTDARRIYSLKFLENFLNLYTYFDLNSNNPCVFPGFLEVFFLNYNLFILPFFFGLNFFSIAESYQTLKYMRTNWHMTKYWDRKHWIIYCILIGFFILNIIFHFANYARDSVLKFGFFLILICLISCYITLRFVRNSKLFLDLTSPTLIMLVIVFLNINCIYELVLFGFCNGLMVAAFARRNSCDIFKQIDLQSYDSFNSVPNHAELERKDEENLDK